MIQGTCLSANGSCQYGLQLPPATCRNIFGSSHIHPEVQGLFIGGPGLCYLQEGAGASGFLFNFQVLAHLNFTGIGKVVQAHQITLADPIVLAGDFP